MRVASPQAVQTTWTLEMLTNISASMIPPCCSCCELPRARRPDERWCFLARATPSTITRPSRGSTRTTRPSRPRSLPEITRTVSSFLMSTPGMRPRSPPPSQHLRRQRHDLHVPLVAELTGDGPEDPGAPGVPGVRREEHHGVVVEADVRAVGSPPLLGRPDDDGLDDLALLDPAARQGVLDRADDRVADARVTASGPAEHPDHQELLGSGV